MDPNGPDVDLAGRTLDGRYLVIANVEGEGPTCLFLAEDTKFSRAVLVGVPRRALRSQPGFAERLQREIERHTPVRHPGIAELYDAGTVDGAPYLVLSQAAGGSLAQRLKDAGGRLPFDDVLGWAPTVATTLDELHALGVVHRDVSPDTIWFDAKGKPVLLDWAVANACDVSDPSAAAGGALPGSPRYVAPEIMLGRELGPEADQYSLAVVVYEAMSGKRPHEASSRAQAVAIKAYVEPAPLIAAVPELPGSAAAAVMRGLSKDPHGRASTCTSFVDAILRGMDLDWSTAPAAPKRESAPSRSAAASGKAPPAQRSADRVSPRPARATSAAGAGASHGPVAPRTAARKTPAWPLALVGVAAVAGVGFFVLHLGRKAVTPPESGREIAGKPAPEPARVTPPTAKPSSPPPFAAAASDARRLLDGGDVDAARAVLALARERGATDADFPQDLIVALTQEVTPAEVEIQAPRDGSEVSEPSVRVVGLVKPAQPGDVVVIDGVRSTPRDGRFVATIPLKGEGPHTLTLTVLNGSRPRLKAPLVIHVTYVAPWSPALARARGQAEKGDWEAAAESVASAIKVGLPEDQVPPDLRDGVVRAAQPPKLTITSPRPGEKVLSSPVRVAWSLDTMRSSDTVYVGPQRMGSGRCEGTLDVPVVEGTTSIRVTVRDAKGRPRIPAVDLPVTLERPMSVPWVTAADEQRAEATRLGIPVAFEGAAGLRYVLIPRGKGTIGSPNAQKPRRDDEDLHPIQMERSYYVSINELTRLQFGLAAAKSGTAPASPAAGVENDLPAVGVARFEAARFLAWLDAQEPDRDHTLPTEEQWEYAARAGAAARFSWGDDPARAVKFANVADTAHGAGKDRFPGDDGFAGPAPVGRFPPNPWGLLDVLGNAAELCADVVRPYGSGPSPTETERTASGPRAVRGGSWLSGLSDARLAARGKLDEATAPTVGLRVMVAVPWGDTPPEWAHVSARQRAEAARLRVPVAFQSDVGIRFVLIPAGTFRMGSLATEARREEKEAAHEVRISKAFYLSVGEVTNAEYRQFDATHDTDASEPAKGIKTLALPLQPVGLVTYAEAVQFATWLHTKDPAHDYRLPTEAEWEYAARAGSSDTYPWGANEPSDAFLYVNGSDLALRAVDSGRDAIEYDDTFAGSAPSRSLYPNAWGLHDMLGNVYEWCADFAGEYPQTSVTDPTGPEKALGRVVRGGCWESAPVELRPACRRFASPNTKYRALGFRVAASLPAR